MERISKEQYDKEAAQLEKLEAMGITPFTEPNRTQIPPHCKFIRSNDKNQGFSALNWDRLPATMK